MFDEIYSTKYRNRFYKYYEKRFTTTDIMTLVQESKKEVKYVTFQDDDADVGMQAFNEQCTVEEFFDMPAEMFLTVDTVVVYFVEDDTTMYIGNTEIFCDTLDVDFDLSAFLAPQRNN